jgi:hypothetical protein
MSAMAQQDKPKVTVDSANNKKTYTFEMGSKGFNIEVTEKDSTGKKVAVPRKSRWDIQVLMMDIGFNALRDNTNYNTAAAQQFLQVPGDMQNENLFSMRQGKSVNFNIYPIMATYDAVRTKKQKVVLAAGIGLQTYNFRFNKNISYINQTTPAVVLDSVAFTKNKLAVTYLSIPLMVDFKTRLAKEMWLVYGVGVSGGYRIDSWTKQISGERGKQKFHDGFNFRDFNACVTGEIGLDGYVRLYASYQLTPLHENALEQNPYAIGIRFFGI